MKTYQQLLALIAITLAPGSLVAQVSIEENIYNPREFSHQLDSISKLNLSIFNQPSTPNSHYLNFQIPQAMPGQNKTVVTEIVELNPRYRYNMPIAKLKSNSKILIAKLDPDFPYHYNMPIKKLGTDEN